MSFNIVSELQYHLTARAGERFPEVASVPVVITEPDVREHGDLATNIAFAIAKSEKKSPLDIARILAELFHEDVWFSEWFSDIRVEAPGFVNFFLKYETAMQQLPLFLKELPEADDRSEKIVIEHTNVNPNKAMHIGHLRNAILGDAIRRILNRVGFTTEVQYYVDDTGVQVADTFVGLQLNESGELAQYIDKVDIQTIKGEFEAYKKNAIKFDSVCWRVYAAITSAYEKFPELLSRRVKALQDVEHGVEPTASAMKKLATAILADHLASAGQFGIPYDLLVWESDVLGFNFWEQAFGVLKIKGIAVLETEGKNAGCWVMKSGEDSASEEHTLDKVLVKADGTVTYTGKDIAYHLWKFNLLGKDFRYGTWVDAPQRDPLATTQKDGTENELFGRADRVYNVIDVRQAYPQQMVRDAFLKLGFEKQANELCHVAYGVVSLSRATVERMGVALADDKKVYSMSGRKGLGVPADKLFALVKRTVEEKHFAIQSERDVARASSASIAAGAIKYFMLRYNPATDIVFDFDEALALEGNTGPYLQYAYARAAGILYKTEAKKTIGASGTLNEHEKYLAQKIYTWPHILERVSLDLNVNLITTYAFELANAFNTFYETSPVLAESGVDAQRLALVSAFRSVLGDVLSVLGIEAPEKM